MENPVTGQQPRLTHRASEDNATAKDATLRRARADLADLLPASIRTLQDDLKAPQDDQTAPERSSLLACIDAELDLSRLADIRSWLWIAGRPMPPRPLHQQGLLNRELVITERLDQHLVWDKGRILIKPLPRFLLELDLWELQLPNEPSGHSAEEGSCACRACRGRRERALGFLFSYAALVAYESDFHIAKENHLLPQEMEWQAWRTVIRKVLDRAHIYASIDPRFHYGELRLTRLNKIHFLWRTPLRGYMSRWTQYGAFFDDNFALLASSTVYIAIRHSAKSIPTHSPA